MPSRADSVPLPTNPDPQRYGAVQCNGRRPRQPLVADRQLKYALDCSFTARWLPANLRRSGSLMHS